MFPSYDVTVRFPLPSMTKPIALPCFPIGVIHQILDDLGARRRFKQMITNLRLGVPFHLLLCFRAIANIVWQRQERLWIFIIYTVDH